MKNFSKFSLKFLNIDYCNNIYIKNSKIVEVLLNYKHNIIIVGSGLVGMAFALSLSKKKINVTILEKIVNQTY